MDSTEAGGGIHLEDSSGSIGDEICSFLSGSLE